MKASSPIHEGIHLLPEFVCKAVPEAEGRLPSVREYAEALSQLEESLTAKQRALLKAHYHAREHRASAGELAREVGYADYRAVNLQYGKLGSMLRKALNYTGEGQASFVLASFLPPSKGNRQWVFEMHRDLADALKQLGWV